MQTARFLIALLAVCGLCSCSQEDVSQEGTFTPGLMADMPSYHFDGNTRVNLSNDLSTITWNDGDQIGLYYQEGTDAASAVFTTLKGGTNTSRFTNSAFSLKPKSTYYAFYPYKHDATVTSYTVDFTGQVQKGNGGTSHIGDLNYMAATVKTDNSGDASISFCNLGCVVQVVVTVNRAGTYTSLNISTDAEEFMDLGTVDMTTGTISAKKRNRVVTLSLGDGITLSEGDQLTANILMAPVDLSGKNLTFTLAYDKGFGSFTSVGQTMYAGKAYRFTGELSNYLQNITTNGGHEGITFED